MTRRQFLALIAPFGLLLSGGQATGQLDPAELKVMTFNIRYAHTNPPNLWPDRRAAVREVIVESGADLVGTQEGLYQQIVDMDRDLPDFEWIGVGREGGSQGAVMGSFYRA